MKRICVLFFFLAGTGVGMSQTTFTARVQPAEVAAGEQFELSYVLSGSSIPSYNNFTPPDFAQFVVLSGPNSSTSVQYINGRMSSSVTLSYYLYARQPGTFILAPASIEAGGTQLKSEAVTIKVLPAGKKPQAQQGTGGGSSQDLGDNLFLRAIPNKQRVRQGEQFIVTYKLYTRINIENYVISKSPTYEGLWAEDFEQPKSPEVTTETVEGKQYRVAQLKQTALFATQAGRLKISPLEVRCAVRLQTQRRPGDPFDIFNDPFFSPFRTQEVDIASNELSITVDRLPGSVPDGFTGAIGTYALTASINRKSGKTGEPLTMKLEISGTGNIRLVSVPAPGFPNDFEVYEPKVTEQISRSGGVIRGTKTAEYLVIPRNAGDRAIEPATFVYFDLGKNAYVTLRSPRIDVSIEQGKDLASGGGPIASREDVRLLGEDIRFLRLSPGSLRRAGASPLSSVWFVAGLLIPPLAFLGAYVYRKRRETLLGNVSLIRSQKAGREASKRLKLARKLLAQGNTESYHAEVARALSGYLGDKLAIPVSALTVENSARALGARGVPEEVIRHTTETIDRAEFARFAPGADSREARQDLLDAASQAITSLEKSLQRNS